LSNWPFIQQSPKQNLSRQSE